jgi:hypothetical protein
MPLKRAGPIDFTPPAGLSWPSSLTRPTRLSAPPVLAQSSGKTVPSEQHGSFWWWLHSLGLVQTRHERADLLRKGWGPPLVITDKDGEVIEVAKLSDDEIIDLDQQLRGRWLRPHLGAISAIPSAPAGWSGTQSEFGKEVEWPVRGKIVTPAENADLAKLQRAGVTEQWATEQAKIYREIARANPSNPTAALRAEWLEKIAARLHGP